MATKLSEQINLLLSSHDLKWVDLARKQDVSKQNVSTKYRYSKWSTKDLLDIADLTNSKLAFIDKDGNVYILND